MKTKLTLLGALTALLLSNSTLSAQSPATVSDTIYMGAGYVNEIYYSLANGNQGTINRKGWDFAVRASKRSAGILTNDAANNNGIGLLGVELYTYPKSDTNGWATVDTAGLSNWKKMVNSTTDLETGAFNVNQKGHPDYGWGIYNAVTHDLVGDSLYIIHLRDGSYRKLWIIRKYSSENKVSFRYAKLDGTADTSVLLDCSPYSAKNFIGFSMTTGQPADFEPVNSASWDLLFTKYMYTYPDGVQYPVTGALNNYGVKVNKFEHVAPDFSLFNLATMDSTRSPIGWEWKYLDNNYIYHVVDSLIYFVQNKSGNIYKLVFRDFAGSSTGRIVLEKTLISASGIETLQEPSFNLAVFPNPADNDINLLVNPGKASLVEVLLTDISGRPVLRESYISLRNELNSLKLKADRLSSGIYLLTVTSAENKITRKIIIQH